MRGGSPVFVITGTPAAGKSSVAHALLRRFPFGLHIPVDDLREMVIAGIAHPVPEWTEETERQFRLARLSAAAMARRYSEAGFAVAIDDTMGIGTMDEVFAPALEGCAMHKVLLLPCLKKCLERNRTRTHKPFEPEILEPTIRDLHTLYSGDREGLHGWIVVDSSGLSVEETVDAVLHRAGLTPCAG